MIKKFKYIAGLVMVISMIGSMVMAEQEGYTFFNEADEAKAITIRYRGDKTATITNTAAGVITLTDDGTANTITLTNTMSYVMADIMDATNSAGTRNFIPDYFCSLSTDSLSNKLIAATSLKDISDGEQCGVLVMDTSGTKSFDVARIPTALANGIKSSSAATITDITGVIGGTGDATVSIYVDGDMKWQNVQQSPVYSSSDGTVFITNALVNANFDLSLYAGKQRVHVRAARATTATTGGVGLVFTQR